MIRHGSTAAGSRKLREREIRKTMMMQIDPEWKKRKKKLLRNSDGEYQLSIGRQIYDGVQIRIQRSDCRDERYK